MSGLDRLGEIRSKIREDPLELTDRVITAIEARGGDGRVVVEGGIAGILGQGEAQQIGGAGPFALIEGQHGIRDEIPRRRRSRGRRTGAAENERERKEPGETA